MAAGAFGPMPAKLAEQAGFEAVYVPGGGTALARLGVADVGLATLTEMVDNAGAIARSVDVPVIADADTGFGNHLNVRRTVQEFERCGVAAIHIEDQTFPKRSGHLKSKSVIAVDEAVLKIRAAVEARTDPDFMIIARCDALGVLGLDEALERGRRYRDAGADMIFIEGTRLIEDIADVPRRLPAPHLFNMSSGGTPVLTADEVFRLGYRLMILPNYSALAAIKAISTIFSEIARTGSVASSLEHCASYQDFLALGGFGGFEEIERRFAMPAEAKAGH